VLILADLVVLGLQIPHHGLRSRAAVRDGEYLDVSVMS
jgi:hypothetical protein